MQRKKRFTCSASEGLALYAMIAHWVSTHIEEDLCADEKLAFTALADVIDCMLMAAFGRVTPQQILTAVEFFLDVFDIAYGLEWSTPKFHWMLHFADHYEQLKMLISCWPLERKHKTPKEYGQDIKNTSVYERSVLHECICDSLAALDNPDTYAFLRIGLFKPRAATNDLLEFLRAALDLAADVPLNDCFCANSARLTLQLVCSVKDVILFRDDSGNLQAGEIWHCIDIDGDLGLLVQTWTFLNHADTVAIWQMNTGQLEIVLADSCVDTLPWHLYRENQAKTLLPPHGREFG